MNFPKSYKVLTKTNFVSGKYSLIPIRYQDRHLIMKWRNEQMYHLRQKSPLTVNDQESYFMDVVSKLFGQQQPNQILFSYLEDNQLIGYGGLVHINWDDLKAEISFIMDTSLESSYFHKHWTIFFRLIEEVAFVDLNLKTIFTYAYDLRPQLYTTLEKNSYNLVTHLKDEVNIDGQKKDVFIHEKKNPITIRLAVESDLRTLFDWTNEPSTRKQSYNSEEISLESHTNWFNKKLASSRSTIYLAEFQGSPCGVVPFEKEETHSVIGVSISPKFRGKKLAKRVLIAAVHEYRKNNSDAIYAYIKKSNLASIKSFERAMFVHNQELDVQGSPSVLYIRK